MLAMATYIGYLASVFLIISLSVQGDAKFRVFNLLGCICFILYGGILLAWPVILTNSILLVINIYYLIKWYKHRENFDIIAIKGDEILVEKFLAYNQKDIANFYPGFTVNNMEGNINFMVLRDMVIANIFSIKDIGEGDAVIVINYTIKKYRDYKISKFLFEQKQLQLSHKGIKRVLYPLALKEKYAKFLAIMHFEKDGEYYVKTIK